MKSGIHPENYRLVAFKDMSNDDVFITKSTANSKETIDVDGVEYPLIKLEISRTSHPYYTGKAKLVDTAGRIDKFKNKYAKFKNRLSSSLPLLRGFLFLDLQHHMNIRLFDGLDREHLLPFVYLRPVADLFMGGMTFRERWLKLFAKTVTVETVDYLIEPNDITPDICILASLIPTSEFVDAVQSLTPNQKLVCEDEVLAYHGVLLQMIQF
ncbi:MAG: hypothetical protein CM15mP59_4180 [Flavobacteriaceae bacterium]|nr:MAG: hypothetical protein CM15mP59_4180 [Flavobacteriaceae bacterium]